MLELFQALPSIVGGRHFEYLSITTIVFYRMFIDCATDVKGPLNTKSLNVITEQIYTFSIKMNSIRSYKPYIVVQTLEYQNNHTSKRTGIELKMPTIDSDIYTERVFLRLGYIHFISVKKSTFRVLKY